MQGNSFSASPKAKLTGAGLRSERLLWGLELSGFREILDSSVNCTSHIHELTMKPQAARQSGKDKPALYGEQWWLTVQSMPLSEALMLLRDYRSMLLRENAGAETYIGASVEISRINAEIHRMTQVIDRSTLIKAMRNVLPPELYEAVLVERERLELFELGRQGKH